MDPVTARPPRGSICSRHPHPGLFKPLERKMSQFSLADLVDKACEKSGLGPFENTSDREGLEVLIREINACEAATEVTFEKLEPLIIETLVNRFRVEDNIEKHPEVLQQTISRQP